MAGKILHFNQDGLQYTQEINFLCMFATHHKFKRSFIMSQDTENQEAVEYIESRGSLLERIPSWLISMVLHTILLIVLMCIPMDKQQKKAAVIFTAPIDEEIVEEEVIEEEEEELEMDLETEDMEEVETDVSVETTEDVPVEVEVANDSVDDEPPPAVVEFTPDAVVKAQSSDNTATVKDYTSGQGFNSRKSADATAMTAGGSRASQNAVKLGLEWIARHQLPDGSWNYNHCLVGNCNCGNPGALMKCTNGATAMGILPFLGCGMTHKDGTYKTQIGKGLGYLCASIKKDPKCPGGGSLHQQAGTMYAHGLATICLTEAFGMTQDKRLKLPAQAAVNFVMYAQDPKGGGWRYSPQQAGDTSVVGWQLMALKSGYMAYLAVNPACSANAMRFLDTVQTESGAGYGYVTPGKAPACTAIGLLCRMYNGWKQDNPALKNGVNYLSSMGPSDDMYYNYYATQVMRHYGGDPWTKWNAKMRDKLVDSQIKTDSHAKGSWDPKGAHADQGGRLYATALSIMTLEVYYRHQPIYQAASLEKPAALE